MKTEKKMTGPQVPFSEELHAQKYRGEGEGFREAMNRIASNLRDDDTHYHEFRDILLEQRFLPAGRIQAAIGSTRQVTPFNCYVSGTIADSFVEGEGCIMERATQAAATMRMGGGIGYDFSTLRPRGDMIKKLQSRSSGPLSFMKIYDAICKCVASSGHRRGAQMGILRVDHPDIEEFINAKQNQTELTGFNISIAITDEFMEAALNNKPFNLRFNGETHREVDAAALWETIMRSTWDWAEPGVIFIDQVNKMNNLYYCETIAATNPCGEQPLPPFGACLLGSFNLVKYMRKDSEGKWWFNTDQFTNDIPHVVRAMDNVIEKAIFPLPQQRSEAFHKRRMGMGITGLSNAAEAQGWPYGSKQFVEFEQMVLTLLRDVSYETSALLAKEKGAFPLFDAGMYANGQFIRTLPEDVQHMIKAYGIRNSHLTSIAPCGTISLTADNVSSGIEPVFAYSFDRTVIEFEGPRKETVTDYGSRVFNVKGKVCDDVTVDEHLAVLKMAAKMVDSAVSKTCNVPPSTPWAEFKRIYEEAWQSGCKGCTTFQVGGKRVGILEVKEVKEDEPEAMCRIDPATGRKECE
jgi:ribonucleoside-diphosphate reductase alpha chain